MGKKSKNIPDNFFGLKYINSFMRMRIRIRDPGIFLTLDPESGMKKIRIRDHPGSATLNKKIDHINAIFLRKEK
jgi:hypothetical protein